ncbi:cellulose binding domain-containing protein [Cellulomonas sp. FA1]|uniref:cellulose binding domain-containing protein n=1 Tax=Cellulomonas sp. FA1 TaxID=1346710 RepID=UPI000AEE983B|nr:cellulose binding domain-containing protein [Cellulomonas sp. FA1]
MTYTANQWPTGFTASVTVRNDGATAVDGWTLRFALSSGQQVTQAWSGTATQQGAQVTVTNAAWNGVIPPGGSVQLGFNGTHGGTNTAPSAFTLNGASCAVA